jgi:hypothetical protein
MSDRHKQYLADDLNKFSDSIDDLVWNGGGGK